MDKASNVVAGKFGKRTKADDVVEHLRSVANDIEQGVYPVPRTYMLIAITDDQDADSFSLVTGGSADHTSFYELLGMLETAKLSILDEAVPVDE